MRLFLRLSPLVTGLLLTLATFLLAAGLSQVRQPVPSIHDEFSYLLAGDTFAHGRVTNPTPECWQSFESYHIIFEPSYASKYPPLQGLLLAVGQVTWGEPIAGVWITSALATACCYWMLLGWMPRRWADLTALVVVLHPSIQLLWGQSYWGGTAAFAAGALVWGAVPRLQRNPTAVPAVMMAIGAALLAISRPYEGFVAVLIASLLVLIHWIRRGWPAWSTLLARVVAPQFAVLAPACALLLYYNLAVTGDPLRLPYMVHEDAYALCPNFVGQQPYEGRNYRHPTMERFHREWAMGWYDRQDTTAELIEMKRHTTYTAAKFFLTTPLIAVLLLMPFWRGRTIRQALIAIGIGWLASMVTIWSWPHYMAPTACLLLVVIGWGLRNIRVLSRRWFAGFPLVRRLPFAAAPVALHALVFIGSLSMFVDNSGQGWHRHRAEMQQALSQPGTRHIVIVRYDDDHPTLQEWVYNAADVQAAPVIWARESDPETNRRLLEHYSGRMVWLCEPDAQPLRLTPYKALSGDVALTPLPARAP